MQDLGYELPRILILRTWVNKGVEEEGPGRYSPSPLTNTNPLVLRTFLGVPAEWKPSPPLVPCQCSPAMCV
jgi:hypothetical protein